MSINRIRLEFKVDCEIVILFIPAGINRIRLEFKGWQPNGNQMATSWY